jgi:hypothetical protein
MRGNLFKGVPWSEANYFLNVPYQKLLAFARSSFKDVSDSIIDNLFV